MGEGISSYLFTQGILGVVTLVLGIVCIKLYNKVDRIEKEKTELLEAWRDEVKDSGKDTLEVLRDNSRNLFYLADKIEVGKEENKRKR